MPTAVIGVGNCSATFLPSIIMTTEKHIRKSLNNDMKIVSAK